MGFRRSLKNSLILFSIFNLFLTSSPTLFGHPGPTKIRGHWQKWHPELTDKGEFLNLHHHPVSVNLQGQIIVNSAENLHKIYGFFTDQNWYFLSSEDVPKGWKIPVGSGLDPTRLDSNQVLKIESDPFKSDPFLKWVQLHRENNGRGGIASETSTISSIPEVLKGWIHEPIKPGGKIYLYDREAPGVYFKKGILEQPFFKLLKKNGNWSYVEVQRNFIRYAPHPKTPK